jgi:hypothetical protein
MKSFRLWDAFVRAYDNVEIALWAALLAFVICMIVFVFPMLPALRTQYQHARAKQIADENALYCGKLNVKPGTGAYDNCLLVLGDFRVKVEQRVYNESDF